MGSRVSPDPTLTRLPLRHDAVYDGRAAAACLAPPVEPSAPTKPFSHPKAPTLGLRQCTLSLGWSRLPEGVGTAALACVAQHSAGQRLAADLAVVALDQFAVICAGIVAVVAGREGSKCWCQVRGASTFGSGMHICVGCRPSSKQLQACFGRTRMARQYATSGEDAHGLKVEHCHNNGHGWPLALAGPHADVPAQLAHTLWRDGRGGLVQEMSRHTSTAAGELEESNGQLLHRPSACLYCRTCPPRHTKHTPPLDCKDASCHPRGLPPTDNRAGG